MIERFQAWQCIGCGRIEGAQPCVGICEDRKAEFVHASDYDATLAQLALAGRQVERLTAVLRQIACTSPKKGECERTWMALQQRARRVLDGPADGGEGGADRASATPRPAPARASASAKAPRRAPRPRGTRR